MEIGSVSPDPDLSVSGETCLSWKQHVGTRDGGQEHVGTRGMVSHQFSSDQSNNELTEDQQYNIRRQTWTNISQTILSQVQM